LRWSVSEIVVVVPDVLPGVYQVMLSVGEEVSNATDFAVVLPDVVYVSLSASDGMAVNTVAALAYDAAEDRLAEVPGSPYVTGGSVPLDVGCIPSIVIHRA